MRPAIILMSLVFLIGGARFADAQARAGSRPADSMIGVDKVKHFFIAGFVESITFAGLQAAGASRSSARAGGIGAATVASFGREIHDRRTKGLFSVRDLFWDAVGVSAALLVVNKSQR